jgi:hypothetical protein
MLFAFTAVGLQATVESDSFGVAARVAIKSQVHGTYNPMFSPKV